MAAALQCFYCDDDETLSREMTIFRLCNEKIGKISRWTFRNEESTEELRALALSQGGLYNASMRQKAWPALTGTWENPANPFGEPSSEGLPENVDMDIIQKDVQRSALFRSEAVTGSIVKGEQQPENLQKKLTLVLNVALSAPFVEDATEKPCYYQGLHDVAFLLLFNFGYDESATIAVLQKLLQTHLKDAARRDFGNVTFALDSFLMPLLQCLDEEVYQAMLETEVPLTNAVLPWLITLFAHPVQDGAVASRLMDAFLAHPHPMLPFYLAVALLVHPAMRRQLLEAAYYPVMMHLAIHGLPGQIQNDFAPPEEATVTAQDLIDHALEILRRHPPESLLRFIGQGRKKRTRQRLLKKAQGLAMLQIPAQGWSWKALAKRFLHSPTILLQSLDGVATRANAVCTLALEMSRMVFTISQETLLALQIIVLFILMPEHYVHKFYSLLQVIAGRLSCDLRPLLSGDQGKEKLLPVYYQDGDIPDMILVKSMSELSISDMDC